jgi:hypothetical protein
MMLQLTYCKGGMVEFESTGTYPRKILVYDHVLIKRWWRKITEERHSGELKMGKTIKYRYHVNIALVEVSIFHHNGTLVEDCLIMYEMRD